MYYLPASIEFSPHADGIRGLCVPSEFSALLLHAREMCPAHSYFIGVLFVNKNGNEIEKGKKAFSGSREIIHAVDPSLNPGHHKCLSEPHLEEPLSNARCYPSTKTKQQARRPILVT